MTKIVQFKGYPKLQKVWNRLLKELPEGYHNLNVFFSNHNTSNYELRKGGWAHYGYIVLGEELVKKNDEYIFVAILAHELGHQVLGHLFHYDDKTSSCEHAADHFGLFLATKAGYDPEKFIEAELRFEKWRKKGIDKAHQTSHGTADKRINLMKQQLAYLGNVSPK